MVHIDQNKKMVMYGVTRNVFFGKVVAFVSMPVKNDVEIYNHLFLLVYLLF
jgi:hypothetical protein